MKKKLCDTCIYRNNVEQLKPCIIYRDDCEFYEKERGDMTDDLISRQAVLDIVDSYSESQSNVEDVTQDIISDIVVLPSVKQESKTGKWVFKNDDDRHCLIFTCSLCGERITLLDDTLKNPQEGRYNFCPNCGAKMESEDKE